MYRRKNNEKNEEKRVYRILGISFLALLLFFFVVNIITKDRAASESENRSLAQKPEFSVYNLFSGTFMEDFESYASDQFAGRDTWRNLYIKFRRIGGSREENGIFLARHSQLLEDIVVPDGQLLAKDVDALNACADAYPDLKTYMLLVPDAAQITDACPRFANVADQAALFDSLRQKLSDRITWIDGISALQKHTDEKLYYKTDHHWTSQGAYDMFSEILPQLEPENTGAVPYDIYPVTTEFNGVLSGSSGFCLNTKEEIDIYVPQKEIPYVVTYEEEQQKSASLYQSAPLETKDKYAVFLGGNHPLIHIETGTENNRKLLLVKDSFANCFVPFLIPYYNEIVIADPRYYAGDVKELMDSYEFTDMMYLYSGNTFFSDNNIAGFLSNE